MIKTFMSFLFFWSRHPHNHEVLRPKAISFIPKIPRHLSLKYECPYNLRERQLTPMNMYQFPRFPGLLRRNHFSMHSEHSKAPQISVSSSLSFGSKTIFDELTLNLFSGDKIVLVGENGVGKSTLLNILSGKLDSHQSSISRVGSLGYLPQNFEDYSSSSIVDCLASYSQSKELLDLLAKKNHIPEEDWMNEFQSIGGYSFFKALEQLGLKEVDLNTKMERFSGGEKVKIFLSILSFLEPDILLLDEPTNHLDAHGVHWLERFLVRYEGILVMTTHDRTLIDKTATGIAELSSETKGLVRFNGGYTKYLEHLKKEREKALAKFSKQQKELTHLHDKIHQLNSAKEKGKAKNRKDRDKLSFNAHGQKNQKGKGRRLKQLKSKSQFVENSLVHVPKKRSEMSMDISSSSSSREISISVERVSKSINDQPLFSDISFTLSNRERLVIQGKNGSGKTTLLKIIAGLLPADQGTIYLGRSETIGFLDQEQETLDLDLTPLELLQNDEKIDMSHKMIVTKLRLFGIPQIEDIQTSLKFLSIGCRRKVQLAQIILRGSDVLLLDEPTNHLDLPSLEHIEEQLLAFPGPIIAVSHDRHFIKKFATNIVSLD